MEQKMNQKDILQLLDIIYEKVIEGVPYVSPSVSNLANDYLKRYGDPEIAAKKMINNQVIKCTTSGAVTGLGGGITLPLTVPANLTSVLYVQMRMIAAVAYLAGLDMNSDQTQTFIYACLAGIATVDIVKSAGVQVGEKLAVAQIKKIPGTALKKINQKVGFRLITKFGETGVINLGKLVPGVGAIIGGAVDFSQTKIMGNRALKMFFDGDFELKGEEDIIDIDSIPDVENEEDINIVIDVPIEETPVDITAPIEEAPVDITASIEEIPVDNTASIEE